MANLSSLQIYTEMYSVPNGDQVQEGEEGVGDVSEWKSDEETEEESEDSSSREEVESPPRGEKRSNEKHDPGVVRSRTGPSSSQVKKRALTATPDPSEKAPKQPKVTTAKTRKPLPKIKVDVPITST